MEAVMKRYEGLARKKAAQFCVAHELDREETMAEAMAGLLVAIGSWDESKGAMSTWVGRCVDYYLNAWRRDLGRWSQTGEPRRSYAQEGTGWMVDFMDGLTEKARELVRISLDLPEPVQMEALRRKQSPTSVCSALRLHLRELGWTGQQIWGAWTEVKQALR